MKPIARRLVCAMSLPLFLTGCQGPTLSKTPTPKVATDIDPKFATSAYWFDQPAIERIAAKDYDALWNACERTLIQSSFAVDRLDYREGYMTSKPLVSKQSFELWKNDIVDYRSQQQSDLATRRRIVHFQISRQGENYVCEPKVVVEHYSMSEHRITDVYQYRDVFSVRRQLQEERNDDGTAVRIEYWYAERRDDALEHAIADRLRKNLQEAVARAN